VLEKLVAISGVPKWLARSSIYATAWHFVFVFSVTIVKSGTNALFLARSNPNWLPFLYVAVAAAIVFSTVFLSRAIGKHSPNAILERTVWATVGLGSGTLALTLVHEHATLLLYLIGEVQATIVSVLFWSKIGSSYEIRDQKKIIGMIASGGMMGAVMGGLLLNWTVDSLGVIGPMAFSWVCMLLSMPAIRRIRSSGRRNKEQVRPSIGPTLEYFLTHRYPIALAFLVMLFAGMGATVDFVFRLESAEILTVETKMAALFGVLNSLVGFATAIFQFFLTSRLLSFAGVFAFAAIVPTLLLALSAVRAFLLPESFAILTAVKGVEMAGAFSLNGAAVALLYNPIPGDSRPQLRTMIDGSIKKLGAALAGVLLGAIALSRPEWINIWLVMVLCVVAILFLPVLRKLYLRALDEKIGLRKATVVHGEIDLDDKATYQALLDMLGSPQPDRVLAAIEILGEDFFLSDAHAKSLLLNDDARVKKKALEHLPPHENPDLVKILQVLIENDSDRRIRSQAVRSFSRVGGRQQIALVLPYLLDSDPGMVTAAIEVCLRKSNDGPARARLDELVDHLESLEPGWRREIARLLGVLAEERYDSIMSQLTGDPEISVRRLAVRAMGREGNLSHIGDLASLLGDRDMRTDARNALSLYGDKCVPQLSETLNDRKVSIQIRLHIPRVLSQIGSRAAAHALLYSNPKDDAALQQRISHRLAHIHKKYALRDFDKDRAADAVRRRLVSYRTYALAYGELMAANDDRFSFLAGAVKERRDQNLGLAFQLLGLHHGMDRMMRIYRTWVGKDLGRGSLVQDALELLDMTLLGESLRTDLLRILEEEPAVVGGEKVSWQRTAQLCKSRDPLLRGLANKTWLELGEVLPNDTVLPQSGAESAELEGEDMAEDVLETMLLLERVDLFDGLSRDDLASIASICEQVELPPGAQLYQEGESGDSLYVIVDGSVTVRRGDQQILELGPGESIGQVSFLDQGKRPVTAEVAGKTPASLLLIDRRSFLDLLTDRPGLMHAFFAVLGARIRTLIDREP
jgi:HEAT repeat protein